HYHLDPMPRRRHMPRRVHPRALALLLAAGACVCVCVCLPVHAADDRDAVSTINHAFATELGTGAYDLGGSSIFVLRFTPEWQVRDAGTAVPGVRLIVPITAGSVGFSPEDTIGGELPSRIDSFSLMPGIELDFPRRNDWMLIPWLRAGASLADGSNEGWLYGLGTRLEQNRTRDALEVKRLHELALVVVDYRNAHGRDRFLRLRNAVDARLPVLRLRGTRKLAAGLYGMVDIVADPPEAPADAGKQSIVQAEAGITFNTDPRFEIGPIRWPRLGLGYRYAGDFSGWRIVIGAPF
ncbi:MAG: hypothetical protein ABW278_00410, partial [Steroidobacteraceae bacterium]